MLGTAISTLAGAASLSTAIILTDQTSLRAAPRDAAAQQAVLREGEMVEVRGERLDYLQVYDYQRERAGFVRASQVRRLAVSPAEAPELLTLLRFVRDTPGKEALAIGLSAAWLKAAPAPMVQGEPGLEVLDALGQVAERLALRASLGASATIGNGSASEATLNAHLDVARRYGLKFNSYEQNGRMRICYDGQAYAQVLGLAAKPDQQARAALGLTQDDCIDPNLGALERISHDAWRAQVLDKVKLDGLPFYLQNRVQMRRASVWSTVAFQQTRLAAASKDAEAQRAQGLAKAAAERALMALASVNKLELPDEDQASYNDAAMRTNASRWALWPGVPAPSETSNPDLAPHLTLEAGQPGETCVLLVDAQHQGAQAWLRRCTFGQVWMASATRNREGDAWAVAVQPLANWRELWVIRKQGAGWTMSVLPPAALEPGLGYAEFAGWVPGGKQLLVAREARGEGKYLHQFAVLNLDTLDPQRQSSEPSQLGPFQRWADPAWKQASVSVR